MSRLWHTLRLDDDDDDNVEIRAACLYPMLTAPLHSSFVVAIRAKVQYPVLTLLNSILLLGHLKSLVPCYIVSHQLKQHNTRKGLLY